MNFDFRGGKTGMIAAAAPMVAGMMSGHSGSGSHHRCELFNYIIRLLQKN